VGLVDRGKETRRKGPGKGRGTEVIPLARLGRGALSLEGGGNADAGRLGRRTSFP